MLQEAGATHLDVIRGGVSERFGAAIDGAQTLQRVHDERTSLRVRRIHVLDERIRKLAFEAHHELDEEINVNAYWSPPGVKMGLAPHADGYDIVVVQVAGAKRWTLHSPQQSTFTLQHGEAFFLPRGLRHQADNPYDGASLHLAFGIYAKTHRSIVEWLAEQLSAEAGDVSEETMPVALAKLRRESDGILAAPDAAERFAAYRRGVEYERMLMTPDEHARSDARRFR